jgi:hypothetical protein
MVLPRFGQKLEWLVIICNNKKVSKFNPVSNIQKFTIARGYEHNAEVKQSLPCSFVYTNFVDPPFCLHDICKLNQSIQWFVLLIQLLVFVDVYFKIIMLWHCSEVYIKVFSNVTPLTTIGQVKASNIRQLVKISGIDSLLGCEALEACRSLDMRRMWFWDISGTLSLFRLFFWL